MSGHPEATESSCALCGRRAQDGAYLCTVDAERVERNLGDVPSLVNELNTTLARQTAIGARSGGTPSKGAERPLSYSVAASEALTGLRLAVRAVADVVQDRRKAPAAGDRPSVALAGPQRLVASLVDGQATVWHAPTGVTAGWLLKDPARLDRFRLHPDAPDAATRLDDAVRRALRTVDRPLDRVYAGQCDHLTGARLPNGDLATCEADLYATPGKDIVRCPDCGTDHDVAFRRTILLAALDDVLAPVRDIVGGIGELLGRPVNRNTFRSWVRRGRLVPHGLDLAGRELYRIGDVIDLATTLPNTNQQETTA